MNVLVVMPLGEFGGGAEQMLATYITGRSTDSRLTLRFLFLSEGSLVALARAQGYSVRVIEAGRLRHVRQYVLAQVQIAKLMDEWKVERILAWMPKAGLYTVLPARFRRVSVYMWRHDIPTQVEWIDRCVISVGKVEAVACSSRIAQEALANSIPTMPSLAIHPAVAPLTVDVLRAQSIRKALLKGSAGPIIGTIARLQPWKRIDLFLTAAAELKGQFPNLRVIVVGGESHGLSKGYGDKLRRLGESLLGESVYFVGEQRNVGDWLEAMDLFVLSSQGEPFGIALVEALAAGKPVVACSGGGPREILNEETVGCLLGPDPTPNEMSEAMTALLDVGVRYNAHVQNRVRAREFSPQLMASRIDSWLLGY